MIFGAYVTVPWIVGWVGRWERLNELFSQVPLMQETVRGVGKTIFGTVPRSTIRAR
jgi:hypothetical protein